MMMFPDWEMQRTRRLLLADPEGLYLFLSRLAERDVHRARAMCSLLLRDAPVPVNARLFALEAQWTRTEEPDVVVAAAKMLASGLPQEEIEGYRQHLLMDEAEASRQLILLEKRDHKRFLALCYRLLDDASLDIQKAVFWLLGQRGERGDTETEQKAVAALAIPSLQPAAAFALEYVGTSAPSTLQPLFACAQQGVPQALSALCKFVETEEDRQKLLQMARVFLMNPVYALREEALNMLQWHSHVVAEEGLLLQAAQRYYDELVFDALGDASVQALPVLSKLLTTVPPDTVEYNDIADSIKRIQRE